MLKSIITILSVSVLLGVEPDDTSPSSRRSVNVVNNGHQPASGLVAGENADAAFMYSRWDESVIYIEHEIINSFWIKGDEAWLDLATDLYGEVPKLKKHGRSFTWNKPDRHISYLPADILLSCLSAHGIDFNIAPLFTGKTFLIKGPEPPITPVETDSPIINLTTGTGVVNGTASDE